MKMTIHRALAELKLLTARITKGIEEMKPLGLKTKDSKVNNLYSEDEFNRLAESTVTSVEDLITRRTKIKSLIVASNAVTKVKIGDREMTVADAIAEKGFIGEKKLFTARLEGHIKNATAKMNQMNETMEDNLKKNIEIMLGKEAVTTKPEEVAMMQKAYRENNQVNLLDPMKIMDKITVIHNEVAQFEAEVDAVLSESNSITTIEV